MILAKIGSIFIYLMEILKSKGRLVVKSLEFYKRTGLRLDHYSRWMDHFVFPLGQVVDECWAADNNYIPGYFPGETTPTGKRLARHYRYYFSIPFAKTLCILANTKEAYKLRLELNEIEKVEQANITSEYLENILSNYRSELKNALAEIELKYKA